jgi:hypothetical protein
MEYTLDANHPDMYNVRHEFNPYILKFSNGVLIAEAFVDAKGPKSLYDEPTEATRQLYINIWKLWFRENPTPIYSLYEKSKGKVLFWSSSKSGVNPAIALAAILTEIEERDQFCPACECNPCDCHV